MTESPALAAERNALDVHRGALRGEVLPRPRETAAAKGTFLHGFFLPFSLIVATLRDRELRGPYLKVIVLRAIAVAIVAAFAFHGAKDEHDISGGPRIVVEKKGLTKPGHGIHVHMAGVNVDLDSAKDSTDKVEVLGKEVPVVNPDATPAPAPVPVGVLAKVQHGWKWIVALVALLSTLEGVAVFFSRRWDDWLSFHASRLAAVKPEDETPKDPKLAIDLKWLVKKMKRRVRGYVVFGAGLPLLALLKLIPTVGPYAFSLAMAVWGWYWLGIFSASKSAHAWTDEETAPSPAVIRKLDENVPPWLRPAKWYTTLWARVTKSVNAPAAVFDRTPAPFLGLALARAILAFPLFYLFARPIVPVAAGRLIAEGDPQDRYSAR